MNSVLGYSSSSEDEIDAKEIRKVEPQVLVIKQERALGGAIKNTFNDKIRLPETNVALNTNAKITDFVPTSLRKKLKKKEKEQPLDLNVGNIFDTATTTTVTRTPQMFNVPTPFIEYKEQLEEEMVEIPEQQQQQQQDNRKLKRTIDESQIIDFNLNDFYNQNNELINKGELNFEQHERQNKKVKYYNSSGTNQLSDLMRFSAKNTAKLNSMHDEAKSIKSQTAQRYGFKK